VRALALLLSLAACTSGPSEYHRGTFVPPPPAPARPGVGLPTYDPHARPFPPQPQPKPTRVLPETPETRRGPGIWASDDTTPPKPKGGKGPVLWDVELPMPPLVQSEDPLEQIAPALACTRAVKQRIETMGLREQVVSMEPHQRTCFLIRLYAFCLRDMSGNIKAENPRDARRWKEASQCATRFYARWCGAIDTSSTDPLADRVEQAWKAASASGGIKQ